MTARVRYDRAELRTFLAPAVRFPRAPADRGFSPRPPAINASLSQLEPTTAGKLSHCQLSHCRREREEKFPVPALGGRELVADFNGVRPSLDGTRSIRQGGTEDIPCSRRSFPNGSGRQGLFATAACDQLVTESTSTNNCWKTLPLPTIALPPRTRGKVPGPSPRSSPSAPRDATARQASTSRCRSILRPQ